MNSAHNQAPPNTNTINANSTAPNDTGATDWNRVANAREAMYFHEQDERVLQEMADAMKKNEAAENSTS